ncbi:Signal transduction histidine kinase, nitrate/nitrite-specific [Paraburkholderia ribeironis]|uniref:Sensor protein n=1 Tax=Paraburkholderia ribeironis TaxID=1247936 RepID=A0A1N7S271_9BURK|nr:histidine kinase [Paraburkholderia ribeironis]SIT41437.1 Signal transduction histidine kinase, nitrate/nitrite-specific [Paraburkholderia ribeironis]
MNAVDRAWLRRYPLYAKTCIVLACLVALIALLFVCTRVQLDNKAIYEQAAITVGDTARLRRIAKSIAAVTPNTAAGLNTQATELVRNDTLLTHWRQRGAPTSLIAAQLAALDASHATPEMLDALKIEIDRQGDALEAIITLLEACTAALLFAGIFALAWGARRAFVLRPALPLHMLAQVGHAVPAGRDEIDRLLTVLNGLVARLRSEQDESAQLKRIVEDHIAFADQSLDLLHYICAQLAEDAPTGGTLEALLQRLVGILRVQRIALVLSETSAQLLGVDAIVAPADLAPHIVRERVVSELMPLSGVRSLPHSQSNELLTVLAAPVRVPSGTYGVLIGEGEADTRYEQRHLHLLETIASVLAHAISNLSRDVRDRRMTLLEERNAIARELHDSLAQSLSYMKIQLARLQAVLPDELSQSDTGQIARAIREGIDSAYRQLRELLTTFRTSVHARGLAATLEEVAEELSSRSEVQISVDNRIRRVRLTVNEELHIGQIVREALTNVVRHARASSALVTLSSNEREVTVTIGDDGRGIATESGGEHHYGLSIMRERSRSLGGRLDIRSNEPSSRIVVTFVPASFAQHARIGTSGTVR